MDIVLHSLMHPERVHCAAGIYPRTRWLLYTLVIAPKVLIAMALWWYGCNFLLVSEDDADLLLNSVALIFVLVSERMHSRTSSRSGVTGV